MSGEPNNNQSLHWFCMWYKETIDFSVGKWSALIKQAKKKQEVASEVPTHSVQGGEAATKEIGHGKYQPWYLFDTIVKF